MGFYIPIVFLLQLSIIDPFLCLQPLQMENEIE